MGGGRNHDRDGGGDRASRRAKRDPPSADHAPAARHGDLRRLREASPPADPRTRRGRVGGPGSDSWGTIFRDIGAQRLGTLSGGRVVTYDGVPLRTAFITLPIIPVTR